MKFIGSLSVAPCATAAVVASLSIAALQLHGLTAHACAVISGVVHLVLAWASITALADPRHEALRGLGRPPDPVRVAVWLFAAFSGGFGLLEFARLLPHLPYSIATFLQVGTTVVGSVLSAVALCLLVLPSTTHPQARSPSHWLKASQAGKAIRQCLTLEDVCGVTTEQCGSLFGADLCTIQQCKRILLSPDPPELDPAYWPGQMDQCHPVYDYDYVVESEHRNNGEAPSAHRSAARPTPQLHLLPNFLTGHKAMLLGVEKGILTTASPPMTVEGPMIEGVLSSFRDRGASEVLCVSIPYLPDVSILIVLEHTAPITLPSMVSTKLKWGNEDLAQLEEIASQVESALIHARLLQASAKAHKLMLLEVARASQAIIDQGTEAKLTFLSMVSHEIRTPMNAIHGMTKALRSAHLTRDQCECVEIISSSAKALLSLLTNVLDLASIEAGQLQLHLKPFNLRKALKSLMTLMSAYLIHHVGKVVTLGSSIDRRIPKVVIGDKQHLTHVLVNLLSNAIKFTQQGSITMRVSLLSTCVDETTGQPRCQLRCEVVDTGVGIEEGKRSALFQAFSQANSSTTRMFEGAGLGLAIAKKLVVLMGGDLDVVSTVGQGSTFWFDLNVGMVDPDAGNTEPSSPQSFQEARYRRHIYRHQARSMPNRVRAPSPSPVLPPILAGPAPFIRGVPSRPLSSSSVSGPSSGVTLPPAGDLKRASDSGPANEPTACTLNAKIMLVEDNAINQKVALRMLAVMGHKDIQVANNGVEAVNLAAERLALGQPFDVILMDLHMPEMGGIDAGRLIKQLGEPSPYIIACTADTLDDTQLACALAGIEGYLAKPIKVKELARMLAAAMAREQADLGD